MADLVFYLDSCKDHDLGGMFHHIHTGIDAVHDTDWFLDADIRNVVHCMFISIYHAYCK